MTREHGSAGPGPLRVLVVDDDPRVRAAMSAELAAAGCEPTAAAPEDFALTLGAPRPAAGARVDVALVDVALPTVDAGLALITDLGATMPVVAFSINGAARAAALAAGALAYLEKDGDTERLLHALHTATRPTSVRSSR